MEYQSNPRRITFDRMASNWDDLPSPPDMDDKMERIADAGCKSKGGVILDVGTGTGILLPALLKRKPDTILALDLSTEMLSLLKNKFDLHHEILPLAGDALRLPVPSQSITAIFCHGVLPHFPNRHDTLVELKRVLQPEGRLVISHAIGRDQINEIHKNAEDPSLHLDILPPAEKLIDLLDQVDFQVLESEDSQNFYFILAEVE
jgi:ubiquinone/menaquinone biosynthesis C-methylase UbiE